MLYILYCFNEDVYFLPVLLAEKRRNGLKSTNKFVVQIPLVWTRHNNDMFCRVCRAKRNLDLWGRNLHPIVWRKAYFFHVRKWRKAYRRVGRERWRTACVLWLAAVKIGGGDGDAEQTWVVIWAMNRRNNNDAAEYNSVKKRRKFALST